jgi:hypothetical protein
MNQPFHMPRQSYPTDVTAPGPSQLPSSQPEPSGTREVNPAKPPQPDRADEQEDEENKRAASYS